MSVPVSSLNLSDGRFDLKRWRSLLHSVVEKNDPSPQIICPFGFEVSRNAQFLKRDLRNFYLYLGIDVDDADKVESIVRSVTRQILNETRDDYPDFYQRISTVSTPFSKIVLNQEGTNTIYLRHRLTTDWLLRDYANYLVATIGGAINRQLKAIIDYDKDPLSRRYLFQLCIIHKYVFSEFEPFLTLAQERVLRDLIRSLHKAENLELSREASIFSNKERVVLNEIVLPFFSKLYARAQELEGTDDCLVGIRIRDFHGSQDLTFRISQKMLNEKTQYIIESYQLFPRL